MTPMKSILLVVALTLATIPSSVAQTPDSSAHLPPRLYELYSWPQSNDTWSFCLLPSPSGVNIPAETIFNKKCRLTAVAQLKRKISEFPTGTRIIWMHGIATGKSPTPESRKLALPPRQTVEQVKRYAGAHGVQMEILSSSPD
jgi:hypothetical protein